MSSWLEMGGYGLYVWGSLGVVLACLLIEVIGLRMRFKALVSK